MQNNPDHIRILLEKMAQKYGDLEKICAQCGHCCHYGVRVGSVRLTVPELPCKFLRKDNTCAVYERRFKEALWCASLTRGLVLGVYPNTCAYVKLLPGYDGSLWLGDSSKTVHGELQEKLRQDIRQHDGRLPDAILPEDAVAFLKGTK